jgi:hypothetical protein
MDDADSQHLVASPQKTTVVCKRLSFLCLFVVLLGSCSPVIALLIYCVFLEQLSKRERVVFFAEGPQWPSQLICFMALAVVILTLWHVVRHRASSKVLRRWILALMFLQVIAAIYYWLLQIVRACRCTNSQAGSKRGFGE